jgi:CheY-like chemotaxis protein
MNEHSNENKMPREQKFENHVLKETIEIEKEVFEESLEKKPIKNILVIDDEEMIRDLFKEGLERFGYEVTVASNGNEGVKFFRENPADLIITDIFMPEKDGHTLIDEIMREFPEANIFAITRELNIAEALGAKRVFAKPVKLSELLDAIKELSPEIKTVSV